MIMNGIMQWTNTGILPLAISGSAVFAWLVSCSPLRVHPVSKACGALADAHDAGQALQRCEKSAPDTPRQY